MIRLLKVECLECDHAKGVTMQNTIKQLESLSETQNKKWGGHRGGGVGWGWGTSLSCSIVIRHKVENKCTVDQNLPSM